MARVLLTRPASESAAVAQKLAAMGHEAVVAPVLDIRPLAAHVPPGRFDAVVATSAHAFVALAEGERRHLLPLPAYAVGRTTAEAARAAGWTDVRVAAGGNAAALTDLFRLTQPKGRRVLYLAGRIHKADLPDALAGDGHCVITLETYDAVALGWSEQTLADLRLSPPSACLHYSRRSAGLAAEAIERHGLAGRLGGLAHLCISDDTAAPLRSRGWPSVIVAAKPDGTSMLQALAAILANK